MQPTFRRRLLASTLFASAAFAAAPVWAQTVPADAVQDDAAADEVIVVTGTLITNPNLERSAPVNVTTADDIELLQSNVAEEILREIPGVVPSVGSAVNNGNGGASFVDLRGLGPNRNIVLLDGTRIVPSGLDGQVDLNNIPLALIERLDVLTGGASTTYGADAVTGVVNFITKQDFAGAELTASQQITERGDGNVFRVDATIGANFDDGRGNAVFSVGYQEADEVFQGDRDVARDTIDSFSGGSGGSGTAVPSRFSGVDPIGVNNGGGTRQVDPSGQFFLPTAAFTPFNFSPDNIFQTPFERFNIYGAARYELSDSIEVYTRGLFSKNTVTTVVAPSGSFGIAVDIPLSNPFMSAAQRNAFCAFDITPPETDANGNPTGVDLYTPRFSQAVCDAAATATDPSDPNYREVTSALFRRSVEAGPRTSDFSTTIFDYRLGLRGALTSTIDWDIFGAYGESENIQTLGGYFLNSRIAQSMLTTVDAAGNAVCQDTSNGCVPANFFGGLGSLTADQTAFLVAESTSTVRTTLAQARGTVSGDFGATLPWASDPIAFAVGGEYRRYGATQKSDALAQSGDLAGAGGAAPNIDGGYDVYEAFGELVLPIVSDRPFFESLTLEAGVRYSDYTVEGAGRGYSTTTYKGGGSWEPGAGLKIRGNYARAVRAPNITELFSPVNTLLTNLANDPCAVVDDAGDPVRPTATGELRAVCLAQGATASNLGGITQPIAGQALFTGGGNINLDPETSDSYTIGVVFQPDFVSGLSLSVDYYNIKVENAITSPAPDDAIEACFGAPDASGNFTPAAGASATVACTSIRRDPLTGSLSGDPRTSTGLPLTLTNSGSLATDGIDLLVSYRRDLGFAGLDLGFNGNYTFNSKFQALPTSLNRECVGLYSANCGSPANFGSIQPKFQWTQRTTLSFDTVDVSLLWRHIDRVEYEFADTPGSEAYSGPVAAFGGREFNFNRVKARDYFDLTGRFGVTENFVLTVTVQNLFDKDPPLLGNNIGTTAFNSGNTFPSTYDALGRRFAVQGRLTF